jgi:hypothetical protein
MGYYIEDTDIYSDEYMVIRESTDIIEYGSKLRIITKPEIIIINNEKITFNFENYKLSYYTMALASQVNKLFETEEKEKRIIETENTETLSPYEKIKIKINFGDGLKQTLDKPLTHKNYILKKDEIWDSTEHFYSFEDEKYYNSKQHIIIEIKNIEGIMDKIIIPFTVLNTVASEYNVKMDLISANLTNDNNISFVFNILNDNQLVFASNKQNL